MPAESGVKVIVSRVPLAKPTPARVVARRATKSVAAIGFFMMTSKWGFAIPIRVRSRDPDLPERLADHGVGCKEKQARVSLNILARFSGIRGLLREKG